MNKILVALIVVLILAAGGLFLWQAFGEKTPEPVFCTADAKLCFDGSYVSRVAPSCEFAPCPEPVACTLEAKICPDGSSVGRVPPNCEFSPCPLSPGWKISSGNGFEFQYPETLTAKYISVAEWPPTVTIAEGEFSCAETPAESSFPARVARRMVDDRVYCVAALSEGAAGSTYTTYTYTTARDGKLISLNFVLRYPQCLNYDDPKQSECAAERETFDLDGVVDRIVGTIVVE
ncbi:MAG: hypothetical protein WC348_03165 [Patescibacteria group bacterium]|jgi:hypothetical protein